MSVRTCASPAGLVAALALAAALAGCGGREARTGAIAPPAELELPQEAVPPGVRPLTHEEEEIIGLKPGCARPPCGG